MNFMPFILAVGGLTCLALWGVAMWIILDPAGDDDTEDGW